MSIRICRLYPYKVALACLFLLPAISQFVYAEDKPSEKVEKHNRIEKVFPFGDELLLADAPLPDKVFEKRRYVFQIFTVIHKKGDINTRYAIASGSAVAYPTRKNATSVSSAHVIQQLIFDFAQQAAGRIDPSQVEDSKSLRPQSIISIIGGRDEAFRKFTYAELKKKLDDLNCEFSVFARAYSNNRFTELIPMKILAITEPENPADVVILQLANTAIVTQKGLQPAEAGETINPYSVFLTPIEPAPSPAKTGETVYIIGFGALQPFVEVARIGARITDEEHAPSIYAGLKNPYSLRGIPVPGFSGGPVIDAEGRMLGTTKGGDGKFTLVISTDDIDIVLKKTNLNK